MTELYYNFGDNAKPPMVIPAPPAALTDPITLENGSVIVISGNLDIGTAGVPHAVDEPLINVDQDSTLIVDGDLALYKDVVSTTPLIAVDSSSKLIVTGDTTLSREGGGAAGVILASVDSLVKFIGTTDLVAFDAAAAIAADGSFCHLSRSSIGYFGQVLFNGGANLAMGAFATILAELGSDLHITDVPGASDALNTSNPAGASVTGIALHGGSNAFVPPWAANTGVACDGVAANGRDMQIGAVAAPADYAGAEIISDAALAAAAELCVIYKP
jgi:hypothetical protein